ncbi:MAG: tRNA (5-methylaminomethyl-2-thiouridine)(34)-methyltransferase MnmD [Myxococcota bacterium]
MTSPWSTPAATISSSTSCPSGAAPCSPRFASISDRFRPVLSPARVVPTDDGGLQSLDYDDRYASRAGARAESEALFIDGIDLPRRFANAQGQPFAILETGFGTGLNFRLAAAAWLAHTQRGCLTFVSIEAHPLTPEARTQALQRSPITELPSGFDRSWHEAMPPPHRGSFLIRVVPGRVHLLLLQDDVQTALDGLVASIDAVFLDGFAPARNPAMWTPEVLAAIGKHCVAGAPVTTYTAASAVRRGLQDAGFTVERKPGFAGKRHRLVGHYTGARSAAVSRGGAITVIGAGLAGACVARFLHDQGCTVTVVDRGAGASNPWLLCRPHLAAGPDPVSQLTQAGWALRWVYGSALVPFETFAMARRTGKLAEHHVKIPDRWRGSPWLGAFPHPSGTTEREGYAQSAAGWLDGPRAVAHLLEGIDVRWSTTEIPKGWVVHCTGRPPPGLTAAPVAGTVVRAAGRPLRARIAVAGGVYLFDTPDGTVVGASRHRGEEVPTEEGPELVAKARERFGVDVGPPNERWSGVRFKAADHAPIVGQTPTGAVSVAHGSKGSVTAPIAAALIEAQWLGLPWPVPNRVAQAISPHRSCVQESK